MTPQRFHPDCRAIRVFVSTAPVDFRKGVHGLVAPVAEGLKGNPYCGDVFVFRSKRQDRLKILVFDGTGMILATKWLEEGGLAWPPIKHRLHVRDGDATRHARRGAYGMVPGRSKAYEKTDEDCLRHLVLLAIRGDSWSLFHMRLRPENLARDRVLLSDLVLVLDAENETLRATIATLKGLIFGARSERLATIGAQQLALDLADEAGAAPSSAAANDDEKAPGKTRRAQAQHRSPAETSAPLRASD